MLVPAYPDMVDTMTIIDRRDYFCGKITAYLGGGKLTDDPLKTFGGYGVVEVPTCKGYSAVSAKMVLNTTFPFTW